MRARETATRRPHKPQNQVQLLGPLPTSVDSATLYLETLREGRLGAPAHGDRCRWDWGVTVQTLRDAEQRHERMQKLADSLTPEQRAALWGATDEWAVKLRRFVR